MYRSFVLLLNSLLYKRTSFVVDVTSYIPRFPPNPLRYAILDLHCFLRKSGNDGHRKMPEDLCKVELCCFFP